MGTPSADPSSGEATPPDPSAPVIVRPPSTGTAGVLILDAVVAAVAGTMIAAGVLYMAVILACALIMMGLMALQLVRYRTEIGPDGVLVRRPWGQDRFAWSDIVRAERHAPDVVRLTLRDGRSPHVPAAARPRGGRPGVVEVLALIRTRMEGEAPPPDRRFPPLVVRRPGWEPVWPSIAVMVIGGVGLGACAPVAAAHGMGSAPVVVCGLAAALLLAGAILLALTPARVRTELGPAGILKRGLRKEIFIPWDDVRHMTGLETSPRVIRLVRRGGGKVTLRAVRDDGTAPDGLGFDDIVALVRQCASIEADPAKDAPRPPAGPLSLRPSRRPLLWAVPMVATIAALQLTGVWDAHQRSISTFLAVVGFLVVRMMVKLLRGRTEVDRDGIRNRLVRRTSGIAWSEVRGLSTKPTLTGRVVTVHAEGGTKVTLAAPRDGLLGRDRNLDDTLEAVRALAAPRTPQVHRPASRPIRITYWTLITLVAAAMVALWRPWLDDRWPGRHEADSLPRACAVADPATARRLLPGSGPPLGHHEPLAYSVSSDCRYGGRGDAGLELYMDLERRTGTAGGTEEAREKYFHEQDLVMGSGMEGTLTAGDVPGLGDQAWRAVGGDARDGRADVRLIVRRGNVMLGVRYEVRRPRDEASAAAEALARRALARIEFR